MKDIVALANQLLDLCESDAIRPKLRDIQEYFGLDYDRARIVVRYAKRIANLERGCQFGWDPKDRFFRIRPSNVEISARMLEHANKKCVEGLYSYQHQVDGAAQQGHVSHKERVRVNTVTGKAARAITNSGLPKMLIP